MIASSIRSPATRTDSATTMPYIEITAASVRPPPMSTIMLPLGVPTGMRAPMAAAGARLLGGVADGALLHARRADGDADHHLGLDHVEPADHLVDEVAQHRFRDQVVGDDAVLHRPDHRDGVRRAAHPLPP